MLTCSSLSFVPWRWLLPQLYGFPSWRVLLNIYGCCWWVLLCGLGDAPNGRQEKVAYSYYCLGMDQILRMWWEVACELAQIGPLTKSVPVHGSAYPTIKIPSSGRGSSNGVGGTWSRSRRHCAIWDNPQRPAFSRFLMQRACQSIRYFVMKRFDLHCLPCAFNFQ